MKQQEEEISQLKKTAHQERTNYLYELQSRDLQHERDLSMVKDLQDNLVQQKMETQMVSLEKATLEQNLTVCEESKQELLSKLSENKRKTEETEKLLHVFMVAKEQYRKKINQLTENHEIQDS